MIGKLKGRVDTIADDRAILDVNGVGYLVFASRHTLQSLMPDAAATLHIETHVREDHIHLYGFATQQEQSWFRTLIAVNGVGTKLALGILSVLAPDQLATALLSQDKAAFSPVSGVGPKLAARLITELKDKVETIKSYGDSLPGLSVVASTAANTDQQGPLQDAVSALTNLGYARSDAFIAVSRVTAGQPDAQVETLIREGLKELAS